jgi:hypothetical protein
MNLYAYVANDPVNLTDPSGEFANFLFGAALGAVVEVAVQVAVEGKGLKDIDGKRVVAAAAIGGLTSGSSTLARAAVGGTLKVAGEKVTLKGAERVVAGGVAATAAGAKGALQEVKDSDAQDRPFDPKKAAKKSVPIPGAGPIVDALDDRNSGSQSNPTASDSASESVGDSVEDVCEVEVGCSK